MRNNMIRVMAEYFGLEILESQGGEYVKILLLEYMRTFFGEDITSEGEE